MRTTTARRVGFAVRLRLRDYLRQEVAHSDPHLIELLAPDPGAKITAYLDFLSQEHLLLGERTVLGVRIRIRIRMFWGFPDLDPLVIDPDPDTSLLDPNPDPLVRGPDPHQNVTDPHHYTVFCKMQRSQSRNPDLDAIFLLLDPDPLEMKVNSQPRF